MILNIALIAVGFLLLIKGADFLVDGSRGIAKKFHIPEIIIGLTIVSIGTSMPELFINISASLNGYEDITIGNIIGSNLCNLLLILGIATIINPIKFKKETKFIEIPMSLVITIIFMIMCNVGREISEVESIILLVLFVVFIGYTVYMGRKGQEANIDENIKEKKRKTIINILYFILGIMGLKFGGNFVVNNAEEIARYFKISEKVIGLTIVALGTSLPELVTTVVAGIKGDSDIAIGNIIGSNIINITLIIGVSGLIHTINYNVTYNFQLIMLIVATIVLFIFQYTDRKDEMTKSNGITYLMLYILYIATLFVKPI